MKYKSPKFENVLLKQNDSLNKDNCIQFLDNHNNMRDILFNINKRQYDNIVHINKTNQRNVDKPKIINKLPIFLHFKI